MARQWQAGSSVEGSKVHCGAVSAFNCYSKSAKNLREVKVTEQVTSRECRGRWCAVINCWGSCERWRPPWSFGNVGERWETGLALAQVTPPLENPPHTSVTVSYTHL